MKAVTEPLTQGVAAPLPAVVAETRLNSSPGSHERLAPGRLRWRVNRVAADFWLNALFWSADRHPGFARFMRQFSLWCAWRYSAVLRRGTMANARRIIGPASAPARQEEIGRAVLASFFDFCADVGSGVNLTPRQMLDRIDSIQGHETYLAARAAGKGAIVVTAHMGSFEVGIAALSQYEQRIHVLFRRDEKGLFERTRTALRRRLGVSEVPLDEGWTVWMRLRDALAANEVVVIQGDRVLPGQKGRRMPFLHGHMMLPTGPIKLAMASGAPVVPIFSVRTPEGKIRIFVEEPIVVLDEAHGPGEPHPALVRLAGVIEKYVRTYPGQWLMVQPAWCEDQESHVARATSP